MEICGGRSGESVLERKRKANKTKTKKERKKRTEKNKKGQPREDKIGCH